MWNKYADLVHIELNIAHEKEPKWIEKLPMSYRLSKGVNFKEMFWILMRVLIKTTETKANK